MTTTSSEQNDTLIAQIAKLEERLEDLKYEPQAMDDEINAIERDLAALRRKLNGAH